MTDEATMAERLYPSAAAPATPVPAPPPAPPAAETKTQAETLYPEEVPLPALEIPQSIVELRKSEQRLDDRTLPFHSVFERTDDPQQRGVNQELAHIFADLEVSATDARSIVGLADQLAASPPDDATAAKWKQDSLTRLREVYGKDHEQALADAQKLVHRDPRVAAMLDQNGLGSHPRVVETIAALARQAKGRGRL